MVARLGEVPGILEENRVTEGDRWLATLGWLPLSCQATEGDFFLLGTLEVNLGYLIFAIIFSGLSLEMARVNAVSWDSVIVILPA